jgi:hypothetical protein
VIRAERVFLDEGSIVSGAKKLPSIGVTVSPGDRMLARMPRAPNS